SSLTVLPALLAKMGPRIAGRPKRANRPARIWPAMLRPAMNHPVASVLIGGLLLLALAAPALGMKVSVEGRETFPKSLATVATYDDMVASFPTEGVSHKVVAHVPASQEAELAGAMESLWDKASDDSGFVVDGEPLLRVSDDGRTAALDLPVPYPSSD